jgi:hypothetical protein
MASRHEARDRAVGVWGPSAYRWSGEERQRAAGFSFDPSGRQRILGFPGGPADPGWPRRLVQSVRQHRRRGPGHDPRDHEPGA